MRIPQYKPPAKDESKVNNNESTVNNNDEYKINNSSIG